MGSKKNPAARRAQKNARRTTRKQKGTRSTITASRTARGRSLFDLNPPGTFYQEWDTPTGNDKELLDTATTAFGADSDEATTTRLILEYRDIYGPRIPIAAAAHLDLIVRDTDLAAELATSMGSSMNDVRESLHSLHAQGMLLVADDESLWMTIPPGTPYSAAGGQWAFVEQKVAAPSN
ncbi:hypothetical protein [Streptomyces sp. LaBMicrA B280]|uniref:hypothetical protein n=1 Tax=Streptomyces sp. LaBMicrA B280 TaxID=3391001 RepID=UPI003BA6E77C